ncbi:hypothetical protein CI109_102431 [Kwoniella shandongensis]|uniref:Uncharacterized protein n=1 Tax=Kwoniella shandongensis TaxID=1734106 RepID=A0A5M6C0W9_9TREE|nr:uncharacterized protein CI109_003250 [Kwoniella shandongensis]KAA5528351.1 hypothetical protein CI109_003250 [Kwoniella shandongensis]
MHNQNPYLSKKPDFARLASRYTEFAPYVTVGEDGHVSLDFQDPAALRALTRCLLKEDWDLDVDLREDRICPTLTNRLDYLLHVLDLEPFLPLTSTSKPLRILDIGTGAVAIYPLLLHRLRPSCEVIATEIDDTSYVHALSVFETNNIPSSSISIQKSPAPDPIFFPLLHSDDSFDVTICNPPFFGSEEEMRHGQELKAQGSHAAPTAAINELITPGGEVAFIGKMIEESLRTGTRCEWYTSLIGKFSSLAPLIDLLRKHKIDNYLLKSIKQAKTTRWILGWSHTATRLPDRLARPELVIPNTAFARLLPAPNYYNHRPRPSVPLDQLRKTVIDVFKNINLDPADNSSDPASFVSHDDDREEETLNVIIISPISNTWSRAARRLAARQVEAVSSAPAVTTGAQATEGSQGESPVLPLLRAKIKFVAGSEDGASATLEMEWLEGRDRAVVENLWKFLLSKADLVGKRPAEGNEGGHRGDGRSYGQRRRYG